jgi:hypothetical protein
MNFLGRVETSGNVTEQLYSYIIIINAIDSFSCKQKPDDHHRITMKYPILLYNNIN